MMDPLFSLELLNVAALVALGLMGGILGGFVGGGGAFVMVPGLMGLGGEALVAVGSNLLHRFGRMATSVRRRQALRRVDLRLLLVLGVPSVLGIEVGRSITTLLKDRGGRAASDFYVSVVVVLALGAVTHMLVRDLWISRRPAVVRPSLSIKGVMQRLRPLQVPPVIRFPASNVVVSLWLVLGIGFVAGVLGGSVALGGFLTLPAFIYLLGAPASVAIATDLSLVLLMGAYGAVTFASRGHVDLHATLLLYLGSIPGFHLGLLGTRLLRETPIRIATCLVLALVGLSRLIAMPVICSDGGWWVLGPRTAAVLRSTSIGVLFGTGALIIALVGGAVLRAVLTRGAYCTLNDLSAEED